MKYILIALILFLAMESSAQPDEPVLGHIENGQSFAIGYRSGQSNSGGSGNIAIGEYYNTSFGHQAANENINNGGSPQSWVAENNHYTTIDAVPEFEKPKLDAIDRI